ncbi:ABC transporter permease [Homoserinibacter sp. YIM 151385]|uniref:ABC transporter permease n=1 Tax=Homoserinibacter sp. YIM 151385 TaxID=2985506 RepID=UPI0022F0B068|nr:ABC transporter permease [Homoserinibacter sp. YIM 151385]WBU37984.1 ABC transporter permease [Homoserinibacter sp. YIM 151385]
MTTAPVADRTLGAARISWIQPALRFALLFGLVALVVYFAVASPLFLTAGNLRNILLSSSVLLILAVPQAVLVIMGYVDLSVGSIIGLTGVAMGVQIVDAGWHPLAAMALSLVLGTLAGLVNGVLVAYTRLSPIIVTLGTLQLYRGITEGVRQNPPAGFGDLVGTLGRGALFGIPFAVWISLLVFGLGALFLYRSAAGRHVYAIGVNADAAFLSGVRVRRIPLAFYALIGLAAGIGGILLASRLDSAPPTTLGDGMELNVLTAVLLGGVAFTGGRGTMLGVLLGVLFLGVLSNGMTLTNVPYWAQSITTGAALVIAAGLDELSQRRGTVRRLAARRAA